MELLGLGALGLLALLVCGGRPAGAARRKSDGTAEYLSPPLDVQLESVNCTAISVRWRMPWRHVSTNTGYKVVCMGNNPSGGEAVVVDIPISLDMRKRVQINGHAQFSTVIGNLKVGVEYSVTVGAYGWAGQGRPSMPRSVITSSDDHCMRPAPPPVPTVTAVSDTEIELSWQPGTEEGSPPVLYFLVYYIRPEMDTEWTSVRVPTQTRSMVLRDMSPDTQYQFMMRAANIYGESHPSPVTGPIWTLSVQEASSGQQPFTDPQLNDGHSDVYDYDTDIFTEQLMHDLPANQDSRLSSGSSASQSGLSYGFSFGFSTMPTSTSSSELTSTTAVAPVAHAPLDHWTGPLRRLHDLPCEDTACPPNSVCIDDYSNGGSHCHCALGRGGDTCSEAVAVRFPKFSGYSHMAFEPLKSSYYSFEMILEFRADGEDGLLLYCGENDQGEGDFASLALIRGKLHFRYNCGTGAAQIAAQTRVKVGVWYTVTVYREGLSGWLRVDNNTPVTGRSQGEFTKITFRTPLYLGGAPAVYWLARAAGTNRGFQGCVQSLAVNGRMIDMRPWPVGRALSGADIGECSGGVCTDVRCENGGVCYANRADGHICLCPLGYRGPLCQETFSLVLPHFNATLMPYLSVPWPRPAHYYLSFMEFEMTFLPTAYDGTLLYSEDLDSRDFLSVVMVGGHVEFRFDCGSGTASVKSEEPVGLFRWHELRVSRTARRGILQLDNLRPVEGTAEGAFTQIRCSSPLYFGGVPNYDLVKDSASVLVPFTGSLQKVTVNDRVVHLTAASVKGVNVENTVHPCADSLCANAGVCQPKHDGYECDCPLGYRGKHCQSGKSQHLFSSLFFPLVLCSLGTLRHLVATDLQHTVYPPAETGPVEIPQFTGRSYLMYDSKDILKRASGSRTHVQLRFRSSAQDGLLMWIGDTSMRHNSDYMFLALHGGAVVFSYNLGSGTNTLRVNGTFIDGRWHTVRAVRDGQMGKLSVGSSTTRVGKSPGRMRQLNTSGALYIGGIKEASFHIPYLRGLVGCMSHLTLSPDFHLALIEDASDGKNINTCLH